VITVIGCCVQDDVNADSISRASDARNSAGSVFQFLPDGSRVFRVRMDVHEFAPEELSVQTDSRQLVVTARQSINGEAGQRRRQMNKTIDLPDDVDVDKLVSRLANDGVLTIEAPANPPTYQAVVKSRDPASVTSQAQRRHVIDHTAAVPRTDQHTQPETRVITTGLLFYARYVLHMFFCFFLFLFFSVRHKNTRKPFSGTAERIFMKLLPNDSG